MIRRNVKLEMLSLLGAALVVADAGGVAPAVRGKAAPVEARPSSWAQLTDDAASVSRLADTISRDLEAAFSAGRTDDVRDARRARAGR